QCAGSLPRLASQPSSAVGAVGCEQLPKGALHDELQVPPEQLMVATPLGLHGRVHEPQWLTSLARSTSQPSSLVGAVGCEQLPSVPVQVELHTPPEQLRVAT